MRIAALLCSLIALPSISWGHPLGDLLGNYQIEISADQVFCIPAGTALPISVTMAHPLLTLHGGKALTISLGCDLYIRGADYAVTLDGVNWGSLEATLGSVVQNCSVSVGPQAIELVLSQP